MTIKAKITHDGDAGTVTITSCPADLTVGGNKHILPTPADQPLASLTPGESYEHDLYPGCTLVLSTLFAEGLVKIAVTNEDTAGNLAITRRASFMLEHARARGAEVDAKIILSTPISPAATVTDHLWPNADILVGAMTATAAPTATTAAAPAAAQTAAITPPAAVEHETEAHSE